MTITVALATSTPTSITVVETSTSISPAANAFIVESLSSALIRPCNMATRSPANGPPCSLGASSSTDAKSLVVSPKRKSISASSLEVALIRGATMYA